MSQHRTRREVLAASPTVAAAVLGGASTLALAITKEADAALLQLGHEWSARRQRLSSHQDRFDEAMERPPSEDRSKTQRAMAEVETALYGEFFEIEERIIATPARTLAGLQLKARVVAREHDFSCGTDVAAIERMLDDPEVTEGRAGLSLAADILRLGRAAS